MLGKFWDVVERMQTLGDERTFVIVPLKCHPEDPVTDILTRCFT